MSRRTIATIPRPEPHEPEPDPDAPGRCRRRHLMDTAGVHSAKAIAAHQAGLVAKAAQLHDAQEAHRRRTGEHD
jgi:hypothetical protein